ncbi:hypothetical protein [Streptosporangium brasiliense]|uniref:Uncharacterized protein n=1 Tax=Streptosporangium brasiliense TaxID=47480 RepID=A0ABT9R6A6_9ACTN|nr:hypothetical protein [Streptosporangium brasiliense]MDP9864783.1 hypothetical protein [Streptosporangium brasiliense]
MRGLDAGLPTPLADLPAEAVPALRHRPRHRRTARSGLEEAGPGKTVTGADRRRS